VTAYRQAFALGRLWVHDPVKLSPAREVKIPTKPLAVETESLDAVVDRCSDYLTLYQSDRYANRYRKTLQPLFDADKSTDRLLSRTAAKSLFKLMAYKDEYEVARLYANGEFQRQVADQFEGDYELRVHLAPPLLSKISESTGRPIKRQYGPWMFKAFTALAKLKSLRGTPFDVFGYSAERRMERRLVTDYQSHIDAVVKQLGGAAPLLESAQFLLALPDSIRGFGPVKAESVALAQAEAQTHLEALMQSRAGGGSADGEAA